eukprot:1094788-Prorocentrum_minimum.AAC.1
MRRMPVALVNGERRADRLLTLTFFSLICFVLLRFSNPRFQLTVAVSCTGNVAGVCYRRDRHAHNGVNPRGGPGM